MTLFVPLLLWWISSPALPSSLTWIWGGSIPSNQLEPPFDWGNRVYRVVWHEVGVVQPFRTCSNHSTTQCRCRFGRVEPPQTCEKLSYEPCSLWSSVVREGSLGVEHPELLSDTTTGLVPVLYYGSNRSWTTPNSNQTSPQAWFPLLYYGLNRFRRVESPRTHIQLHRRPGFVVYGSNRFGKVEPPWTHEKLSYESCSLRSSVLRGVNLGWFNSYEPIRTIVQHREPSPSCVSCSMCTLMSDPSDAWECTIGCLESSWTSRMHESTLVSYSGALASLVLVHSHNPSTLQTSKYSSDILMYSRHPRAYKVLRWAATKVLRWVWRLYNWKWRVIV